MSQKVAEKTDKHASVEELYSTAAKAPQPGLCCPKPYMNEMTAHIPKEAFEFNYGCGSPVLKAGIKAGDTVVDLGSGVGIDCFVAAKLVGPKGKVIGIDLTEDMLAKANKYKAIVAQNLGYDVVEFRKGLIESIPLEAQSADVVLSNCVVNLSPDKEKVLNDVRRVLKIGGRAVISDIVSDRDVEQVHQDDKKLWAECYTGALSVKAFLEAFKKAGFYGLSQLAETAWQEVESYNFASITVEAFNYPKSSCCGALDHFAVYLGPYESVADEDGHQFPRFKAVPVCAETASRLAGSPFESNFVVAFAGRELKPDANSCAPGGACCG